jgi:K+-sensing histidine kinase KdpD
MNDEIRENLFNMDVNTSRKGTADEPSTGLGLLLCKEFVEKHNGEIQGHKQSWNRQYVLFCDIAKSQGFLIHLSTGSVKNFQNITII